MVLVCDFKYLINICGIHISLENKAFGLFKEIRALITVFEKKSMNKKNTIDII